MAIRTVSVEIDAPAERVFSFLSNIENLPTWAIEFCRELKKENGKYKLVSCDPAVGEIFFAIEADPRTGVIDMFAGPDEEQMGTFPTRVVSLPGDRSAYVFTMTQAPGMPAELFEAQYESLQRELEHLQTLFG